MRAELLEMVGGDAEVLREIVGLFLEDVPMRLAALADALQAGDLTATYRAAHTLKGAAGNFGVPDIMQAALAVEQHARGGDLAAARQAAAALEDQLARLVQELKEL
jgi:HPt (histidine-containing phosphotransfer) domain-containing protein